MAWQQAGDALVVPMAALICARPGTRLLGHAGRRFNSRTCSRPSTRTSS